MNATLEKRFDAIDKRLTGLEGNIITVHNDLEALETRMNKRMDDGFEEIKTLIISQNGHSK